MVLPKSKCITSLKIVLFYVGDTCQFSVQKYLKPSIDMRLIVSDMISEDRVASFAEMATTMKKNRIDILKIDKTADLELAMIEQIEPLILDAAHASLDGVLPTATVKGTVAESLRELKKLQETPLFRKGGTSVQGAAGAVLNVLTDLEKGDTVDLEMKGASEWWKGVVSKLVYFFANPRHETGHAKYGKEALRNWVANVHTKQDADVKEIEKSRPFWNFLTKDEWTKVKFLSLIV